MQNRFFYGGVGAGKIVNKGLTNDGLVRFGVADANVGANAGTGDRATVKTESDVLAKDYPYVVMVYKTNIQAPQINFNLTTVDGNYPGGETKLFAPQSREVGALATAVYGWNGSFGDTVKFTGVYAPIYSTTSPAMSADDYFDVRYIGFFKNQDDADAFDYDAYLESLEEEDDVIYGDVNGDGEVDMKDLTRLAQYFARWEVEIDAAASDANGDGTVDRKDLTRLAQYFARWEVTLGK